MTRCEQGAICTTPVSVDPYAKPLWQVERLQETIKVLFFTDPICSHCWALEPAWRKFSTMYGGQLETLYLHGGLLPGWKGFSDAGNGISKPADVAVHWAEVARHTGQPIDPSVWLNDPLDSSFPSCLACLAVRLLNPEAETRYLRSIREAVFLRAQNIARESVLADCAEACGLNRQVFLEALRSKAVQQLFASERHRMSSFGVRGFPSLLLIGPRDTVMIRGARPFADLENALVRAGGERMPMPSDDPLFWLQQYRQATTRELVEASGWRPELLLEYLLTQQRQRLTLADADYWSDTSTL